MHDMGGWTVLHTVKSSGVNFDSVQTDLGDDALEVVESTQISIQQVVHDRSYHVDGCTMPNVWKGVVESCHVIKFMLFTLIAEEKLKSFAYQLRNKF